MAQPVSRPSSIHREHSRKNSFCQSLLFGMNVDTSDVIQSVRDHCYRKSIFISGKIDFLHR
ncbi:hypothetical protein CVS37_35965 [Burkholderia lata]|nr:hypothetical protein CVS37_35965 [Burkholderia lata]